MIQIRRIAAEQRFCLMNTRDRFHDSHLNSALFQASQLHVPPKVSISVVGHEIIFLIYLEN
jgi:hypothetical protein